MNVEPTRDLTSRLVSLEMLICFAFNSNSMYHGEQCTHELGITLMNRISMPDIIRKICRQRCLASSLNDTQLDCTLRLHLVSLDTTPVFSAGPTETDERKWPHKEEATFK